MGGAGALYLSFMGDAGVGIAHYHHGEFLSATIASNTPSLQVAEQRSNATNVAHYNAHMPSYATATPPPSHHTDLTAIRHGENKPARLWKNKFGRRCRTSTQHSAATMLVPTWFRLVHAGSALCCSCVAAATSVWRAGVNAYYPRIWFIPYDKQFT